MGVPGTPAARIVVIDDDAVVRAALEHHLSRAGHRVVSAVDGESGLALIRIARPDVVLLDLELPGAHGLEILDELSADPDIADIPVIVLTGTTDDATLAEALGRGAQDFVVKPPSWPVLDARIRVAVRLKRLQDELRGLNGDLVRLSETDVLTGVANRRHGEALLARHAGSGGVTVLKVDVDRFKRINDERGHAAGDVALRAVALALRDALRRDDHVVRWGGDEFIAVLADADHDAALRVAERLRHAVAADAELVRLGGVTVSVGIAHGSDPLDALAEADAAMYVAKRGGGDAVRHGVGVGV